MNQFSIEKRKGFIIGNRKRIISKCANGDEILEEFDVLTDELLLRCWCKKNILGSLGPWEIEIGFEPSLRSKELFLAESLNAPTFIAEENSSHHLYRIRSFCYNKTDVSVNIEFSGNFIINGDDMGEIVVRTISKKYFKRIPIFAMVRLGLPLDEESLEWDYQFKTLIIKYLKHAVLKKYDELEKKERDSMICTKIDVQDRYRSMNIPSF